MSVICRNIECLHYIRWLLQRHIDKGKGQSLSSRADLSFFLSPKRWILHFPQCNWIVPFSFYHPFLVNAQSMSFSVECPFKTTTFSTLHHCSALCCRVEHIVLILYIKRCSTVQLPTITTGGQHQHPLTTDCMVSTEGLSIWSIPLSVCAKDLSLSIQTNIHVDTLWISPDWLSCWSCNYSFNIWIRFHFVWAHKTPKDFRFLRQLL